MRKILAAFFVFAFLSPVLSALEAKLLFTLAVNIEDQFQNILPSRAPFIHVCQKVLPEQHVRGVLLLNNPAVSSDGKVLVEIESIRLRYPNGEVRDLLKHGEKRNALQGIKRTPDDFSGILLSNVSLNIVYEKKDIPGKYTYKMRLRDLGDNSIVDATTEVELFGNVPEKVDVKVLDRRELDKFVSTYAWRPCPEMLPSAFAAFIEYDKETRANKKRPYNPFAMLCFFSELYKLNPHLRPVLAESAAKYSPVHKRYIALILMGAGAVANDFRNADSDTRALFESFKGKDKLAFKHVTMPFHLDALWSKFFATGKVEPLRRIVNELREREVISLDEARRRNTKLNDAEKRKVLNGVLTKVAEWSLVSNATNNRLVFFYLEAMLARKDYPDEKSGERLKNILSRINIDNGNNSGNASARMTVPVKNNP